MTNVIDGCLCHTCDTNSLHDPGNWNTVFPRYKSTSITVMKDLQYQPYDGIWWVMIVERPFEQGRVGSLLGPV